MARSRQRWKKHALIAHLCTKNGTLQLHVENTRPDCAIPIQDTKPCTVRQAWKSTPQC